MGLLRTTTTKTAMMIRKMKKNTERPELLYADQNIKNFWRFFKKFLKMLSVRRDDFKHM